MKTSASKEFLEQQFNYLLFFFLLSRSKVMKNLYIVVLKS